MPLGPSPTIGLIAYTTIKVIGYSWVGRKLNQWYQKTKPRPYLFGIARTILGLAVGITALYLLEKINSNQGAIFLISLIPIRFFEWLLIIYIFYERFDFSFKRICKYSLVGIIYSFLFDIPVITFILIIPGGYWVC
jgi:hypothetical protein